MKLLLLSIFYVLLVLAVTVIHYLKFNSPSNIGAVPVESSSTDIVVVICNSCEFPNDQLFVDIARVLKPGGTVLVQVTSQSTPVQVTKYSVERKLLLAGFVSWIFGCTII